MRKTNVFVAWESCTVKHSVITSPCPAHGKVSFGSAWGAALLVCRQGGYGTAVAHPCSPQHWRSFLHGHHPVPHGLGTDRQGRLVSSCSLIPTNAHRGMSPEGSFKRAADSSAPREAVPRTAAYVVGKISLFLLTPAQHPLLSKMIPPTSTD